MQRPDYVVGLFAVIPESGFGQRPERALGLLLQVQFALCGLVAFQFFYVLLPLRSEQVCENPRVFGCVAAVYYRSRIVGGYFYGRMELRGGGPADYHVGFHAAAFQFLDDLYHLVKRRRYEPAQAYCIRAPPLGFVGYGAAIDHDAQILDFIAVAGGDYRYDVLADVVHIALYGGHYDLAGAFRSGCRAAFDVRRQSLDGAFHHAGAFHHLRQEHFSRAEQFSHLSHGRHQHRVYDRERRLEFFVGFKSILCYVLVQTFEHGVANPLFEPQFPPCVGMGRLRVAVLVLRFEFLGV